MHNSLVHWGACLGGLLCFLFVTPAMIGADTEEAFKKYCKSFVDAVGRINSKDVDVELEFGVSTTSKKDEKENKHVSGLLHVKFNKKQEMLEMTISAGTYKVKKPLNHIVFTSDTVKYKRLGNDKYQEIKVEDKMLHHLAAEIRNDTSPLFAGYVLYIAGQFMPSTIGSLTIGESKKLKDLVDWSKYEAKRDGGIFGGSLLDPHKLIRFHDDKKQTYSVVTIHYDAKESRYEGFSYDAKLEENNFVYEATLRLHKVIDKMITD